MGFSDFKTAGAVAREFKFSTEKRNFIEELPFDIWEDKKKEIAENLLDSLSYLTEEAVCESIIKPVLNVLDKKYDNFRVWSHPNYIVDASRNLSGKPDYLVAPSIEGIEDEMDTPPLCIIEAKRQDWDNAWAQAAAEMYAASTQGATMCYAVVTSGDSWQFGKFDKKADMFTKHLKKVDAIDESPTDTNLQRVFYVLNWIFNEASKATIIKENDAD